ncbi:glutamate receptor 3-like [Haemaphysalis longicornis]
MVPKADIALGPLAMTYERSQVATFSSQVVTEYLTILAGFPDAIEVSAFGMLMAFDWQVWLGLMSSLLVCILASVLSDGVIGAVLRQRMTLQGHLEENWWLYLSALFCESSTKTPRHTPGRILLAVWWLTVVVLMNAFSGHMKATMVLIPDPERIDSLKDLARRTDIRPFLWHGTAYEDLLKTADSSL